MQLQKATRKKSKLRLNISGPSGSGKTYSALLMAKGLVSDWAKIAVIDTEAGSAALYNHLGDFNAIDLEPPYSPERYIEAIDVCIKAGMECIIVDSSSHEWSGAGGCIEINEKLAQSKYKGNTWSAWSQTTPRHEAFVNKVLQAPVHVITCTRSKMETVMTDDKKVKKLGMKDIQRENWEYELTVSLNLDRDTHTATASKDRTELFDNKDPFVITEATGELLRKWCETGVETVKQLPAITDAAFTKALDRTAAGEKLSDKLTASFTLTPAQLKQIDYYQSWYTEINKQANGELEQLAAAHANELNDPRIKQMFDKRSKEIGV
jgi:hypothetical protein